MDVVPNSMESIITYAQENLKFRIANVELNSSLADVKAGDEIITGKGNQLYVIRAIKENKDNWGIETVDYVDRLTREYSMKKMNITSVKQIIKFETWCKNSRNLCACYDSITPREVNDCKIKNDQSSMKSMNYLERMKEKFLPKAVENVKIATDGNICVETTEGYVTINQNNELTSYPEELTLDLPVYSICKPISQLQVGDVIALAKSYAKVTKITSDKIYSIGYTGTGKTVHPIKDVLFGQSTVRVIVSLAGNLGGQINPMLLMAMSDKKEMSSLLPLMMMQQNQGAMGINPAFLFLMDDKGDKSSMKDLLMMSMLSGNSGMFGNLFGGVSTPNTSAKVPVDLAKAAAKSVEEEDNTDDDTIAVSE